jgi:hypothetical protein
LLKIRTRPFSPLQERAIEATIASVPQTPPKMESERKTPLVTAANSVILPIVRNAIGAKMNANPAIAPIQSASASD